METMEALKQNSQLLSGARAEETNPISKSPIELMELRDAVRKMEYSAKVLETTDPNILPKNVRELRNKLNEEVEKLVENDKAENDFKKYVPTIVLKNEDQEKDWVELGWSKSEREQVKEKLKVILGIKEDWRIENILHMLIASGKTPQEVLPTLNDDTNWTYYTTDAGQKDINDLLYSQNSQLGPRFRPNDTGGAQKFLYLQDKLGLTDEAQPMNDIYIRRFVLDYEFRDALKSEYDNDLPENLFDLAWNIGYHEPKYAMGGDFPVLRMQVERYTDENGKEKTRGRFVVDQGNLIRWLRYRMHERWDVFETDEVPNFYDLIKVDKGVMSTVSLSTMIFDKNHYFKDETGFVWNHLYNQMFILPFNLLWERQYAVMYNNSQDTEDELVKAYQEMTRLSKFTRRVGDMSMPHKDFSESLDYKGKDSDSKVGEGMLTMFLTYYNLADFDMLKKVLGEDSKFFTLDGWTEAASRHFGKNILPSTINALTGKFFGDREKDFAKAFDEKTGKVTEKTKDAFIKFVNIYTQEQTANDLIKTLKEMVKMTVEDKFYSGDNVDKDGERILDEGSLNYAWLKAHSYTYFTGVLARNNIPGVWGQPETRWQHTRIYRRKYMKLGGAGFERDIDQIKKTELPLLEGLLVHNKSMKFLKGYKNGEAVWEDRYLTPMEVMLEMHKVSLESDAEIKKLQDKLDAFKKFDDPNPDQKEQKAKLQREITRLEDVAKNVYRTHVNELEFNDNAMRIWSKNLVAKGKAIYDYLMKGQEATFDKFTTYDSIFRGVSFNRAEWQESLQSKLITPLRYFFEANGATNLNMLMHEPYLAGRDDKGNEIWKYKEMYSGEAILGHQTLDIPECRMTARDIKELKIDMREKGWRKRGKYIVDKKGRHVINYDKVQGNKRAVWQEAMLTILASRLRGHIDLHSTDPAYSLDHYMSIIEAIERLPGDLASSEFDMNSAVVTKYFFSKEQMERFKRKAGATRTSLYNRQFWSDLFIGDKRKKESGVGESTSIILGAIFKGY